MISKLFSAIFDFIGGVNKPPKEIEVVHCAGEDVVFAEKKKVSTGHYTTVQAEKIPFDRDTDTMIIKKDTVIIQRERQVDIAMAEYKAERRKKIKSRDEQAKTYATMSGIDPKSNGPATLETLLGKKEADQYRDEDDDLPRAAV